MCPLERAAAWVFGPIYLGFVRCLHPPLTKTSRETARAAIDLSRVRRSPMSRPAIMRGLQNCGGRGSSYAKLVEAEPEPVARATPPYDYLEHTEEGKQEK